MVVFKVITIDTFATLLCSPSEVIQMLTAWLLFHLTIAGIPWFFKEKSVYCFLVIISLPLPYYHAFSLPIIAFIACTLINTALSPLFILWWFLKKRFCLLFPGYYLTAPSLLSCILSPSYCIYRMYSHKHCIISPLHPVVMYFSPLSVSCLIWHVWLPLC